MDKLKIWYILILFQVTFDLEGQSTPKTLNIWTKVSCPSDPSLVILAWTGDGLSCGHTDRRRQRQCQKAKQASCKKKQSQVCRHVSLSNPLIRRYIFLGHIFYTSVLKRKCYLGNMETPPFIYLVDKTTVHICYSSFQNTFAHYQEACIVYHIIKPG